MAKRSTFSRYRDRKSGRFVSQKTWQRSKSKRYVRESVPRRARQAGGELQRREKPGEDTTRHRLPKPVKAKLPEPTDFEDDFTEDEEAEYGGAFDSPGKKK